MDKQTLMNKQNTKLLIKKILAFTGIFFAVAHLVYYTYKQYDALYFFLGFGLLWILFVFPLKYVLKD